MAGRTTVEVKTEPRRRQPVEFEFIQHRIESGVARMTLEPPRTQSPERNDVARNVRRHLPSSANATT